MIKMINLLMGPLGHKLQLKLILIKFKYYNDNIVDTWRKINMEFILFGIILYYHLLI